MRIRLLQILVIAFVFCLPTVVLANSNSLLSPVTDTVRATLEKSEDVEADTIVNVDNETKNEEDPLFEINVSENPLVETDADVIDTEISDKSSTVVDTKVVEADVQADLDDENVETSINASARTDVTVEVSSEDENSEVNANANANVDADVQANLDKENADSSINPSARTDATVDVSSEDENSEVNTNANANVAADVDDDKDHSVNVTTHSNNQDTRENISTLIEKSLPSKKINNEDPNKNKINNGIPGKRKSDYRFFEAVMPSGNPGTGLNGSQMNTSSHTGSYTSMYAVLFYTSPLIDRNRASIGRNTMLFYYDQWLNAPPSPPPKKASSFLNYDEQTLLI